jgi:hypothetical protein
MNNKTLIACFDAFAFRSGDCQKNAVSGFRASLPLLFSVSENVCSCVDCKIVSKG